MVDIAAHFYLIPAAVVVVLAAIYKYYERKKTFWTDQGIPSNGSSSWLGPLGIVKLFYRLRTQSLHDLFIEDYQHTGPVYGYDKGLVIGDPELIKQIGIKDAHVFTDRQVFGYSKEGDVSAKFITRMQGDAWRRTRSILTGTFTAAKMRRMMGAMDKTAREAVDAIAEQGDEFSVKDVAGKFTLDVIARCCFAMDMNSHKIKSSPFIENASKVLNLQIWRFLMPKIILRIFDIDIFPKEPVNYFRDVILHLIKQRRERNIRSDDFLQLLLDVQAEETDDQSDGKSTKSKTLNEDEIVANSVLFFVAGYDTTASAISFALYHLCMHQDIQERLYQELKSLGEDNPDQLVTSELLEAVLYEALRLNPPAGSTDRMATEDYTLSLDGQRKLFIPKGTNVLFPIVSIHHDPKYHPDPEQFRPERFLPENKASQVPYTFLPFGLGPRNCIGLRFAQLEAKLLIARIVLAFRLIKTGNTLDKITYQPGATMPVPIRPLVIGIEKRTS